MRGCRALRRRVLHRRAADALARQPGARSGRGFLHLGRAGDAREFDWLVRAGERAWRATHHGPRSPGSRGHSTWHGGRASPRLPPLSGLRAGA